MFAYRQILFSVILGILLSIGDVRPASAGIRESLYRASQGTVLAAAGADGFSTMWILARNCGVEANPAIERWSTQPGIFGAVMMTGAGVALWAVSKIPNKTVATWANVGIAGFRTGVTVHNMRIARRCA